MATKICTKCKKEKDASEFWKDKQKKDGLTSSCAKCNSEQKKNYYGTEHHREIQRRYRKTEKGREITNKSVRKWRAKNKLKVQARIALNLAISKGQIVKPETCELCGFNGVIDGHHWDYSKPLDAVWCCRKCHKRLHK
jgi:hypothetical protein